VRGRDWESTEHGKGGGRGRGREKFGKEESRERDPSELWSHRVGLIIWGEGKADEVGGGEGDVGRKGWRQREQTSRKISARKRRRCHWPECPTQEWARQWAIGEREWE